MSGNMNHTQLTVRNFAGYVATVITIGTVTVGFGAIDLIMVAPKGLAHVAAIGQGDLVFTGINAFFLGMVSTFTSRLSMAEGKGSTGRDLPLLATVFLIVLVLCQALAALLLPCMRPLLSLAQQPSTVIGPMSDYVGVRLLGVSAGAGYYAISEALKICGFRGISIRMLVVGFLANAGLDWLFLDTKVALVLPSPEAAVAAATVLVQLAMAATGLAFLNHRMRKREDLVRPELQAVATEFRSIIGTAPGVGLRHLNDYVSGVAPGMFIGTLGVRELAASAVATKIYVIFCRVPQACVSATAVFYGYIRGQGVGDLAGTTRRLLRYSMAPNILAVALFLGLSPWLVTLFGGRDVDAVAARWLFFAFVVYLPAYVLEKSFGEILTVHQRGNLLFWASTFTTYALTLPMAWCSVFVLKSPFIAIASNGVSTLVLGLIFWHALRKDYWARKEVPRVQPTRVSS